MVFKVSAIFDGPIAPLSLTIYSSFFVQAKSHLDLAQRPLTSAHLSEPALFLCFDPISQYLTNQHVQLVNYRRPA